MTHYAVSVNFSQEKRASGLLPCRLARVLTVTGELLGTSECFYCDGSFHFPCADGWSIRISPESAGAIRISACLLLQPRATLWSPGAEDDHLAGIVLGLATLTRQPMIDAA